MIISTTTHPLRRAGQWMAGLWLLGVTASAGAQSSPPAFPPLPKYELQACCNLCPAASDPATYQGYLDGFRMIVQGDDGWLFRTEDGLRYSLTPTKPSGYYSAAWPSMASRWSCCRSLRVG